MATERIRVGIIGASMRNGWARDAHIPALSALPEFEITAVSTSRRETANETAKHFGIPHAFADPYKMVQHPDVDLVSICVRVPFHHQLGMAALNAGKHLYCEWPLAATTEQAQQMRDLAVRVGVHHMVGLQARGAPAFNRVRDLIGIDRSASGLPARIRRTPGSARFFSDKNRLDPGENRSATLRPAPIGSSSAASKWASPLHPQVPHLSRLPRLRREK
jgi:predicted dehydrogenase